MATAPAAKKPRAKKAAVEAPITDPVQTITAWKGFDVNLQCRGYQFTVGETFIHAGRVAACSSGFHSCVNPLDVWSYYIPADGNRFCRVQASGTISNHEGDSKLASSILTVETEVTLGEMIRAGVKHEIAEALAKAEGGDYATNASSGHSARNASSGDFATNASSGYSATNASSGHSARNASSGHSARNASSGHSATNASSGYSATNASSGHSARNASSGDYATNASSGHSARNASSGDFATNASSGYSARNASSGYSATNASSGHSARNASSGHSARNEATGENSVIAAAGLASQAKGAAGTAIALPYKDASGQIRFAIGVAGEDGVPVDKWLIARDGKLVEAA